MTRGTPTSKLLLASAMLGYGCATATDLDAGDRVGSITAAVELGALAHDVTGVRFDVLDAASACDGTVLATETRALESEPLPASLAGDLGAYRPFADALFVLEPGQYRICATPLAAETVASSRCAQAQMEVSVADLRFLQGYLQTLSQDLSPIPEDEPLCRAAGARSILLKRITDELEQHLGILPAAAEPPIEI